MVTASVGFQCPECAHQGAKQQRLVDVHRRATVPYVTYTLIAINVAVFIVGAIADHQANVGLSGASGSFTDKFGMFSPCVGQGQWYRLITGGFLHAGFLHIAFNMWALFVIGRPLEAALGRLRFSLLYGVSLLGGALGVVVVDRLGTPGLTVGASGAIFGLFGALAVMQYEAGMNPLRSGLGFIIGINLLLTFTIPGISIGGHIGGLLVGGAAAALLVRGRPLMSQSQNEQLGRNIAIGVLGLACLAIALVVAHSMAVSPSQLACPAA
jgi:membrane associated rhomboid family serine protease